MLLKEEKSKAGGTNVFYRMNLIRPILQIVEEWLKRLPCQLHSDSFYLDA